MSKVTKEQIEKTVAKEERVTIRQAAQAVGISDQAVRIWIAKKKILTIPESYTGGSITTVLLSEVQAQMRRTEKLWIGITPEVLSKLQEIADAEYLALPSAVEFIINRTWAQWYTKEKNDATD